jgi:hypothetical protein
MHKSATKCNETIGKWCKNKHGASKIIDTFETYHPPPLMVISISQDLTLYPITFDALLGFGGGDLDQHLHGRNLNPSTLIFGN